MKKQPKLLYDKDPWMLAEDIPDSDVFFFQIPMSCFASDTSYPFLKSSKKVLTHYKKFHMDFYFGEKDSNDVADSIMQALLGRSAFGSDLNKNIVIWSHKLIEFAQGVAKQPLNSYTNKQLWQIYDEHDKVHTKLYTYGWLPVSVDMFHNNFTKVLKSYLYGICKDKAEAETAFIVLTTPNKKTIVAEEREEFLEIYEKYYKFLDKPNTELISALQVHQNRWGHMGYIYAGNVKPFGADHYLKEMQELAASNVKARDILRKETDQLKKAKENQEKLYKKLKMSSQYRQLFQTAADFALTKLVRRHAQLMDLYLMHTYLLTEIAKRLKLSRYEVQFMLKDEVYKALVKGKVQRKTLKIRLKECALYTEKDFEAIYIGSQKDKITHNLKKVIDKNQTELTGQTAQPGIAKGAVKIIIRAKDMGKMNKGDILVSIATDPDIVPAMKKAAAIVTEQGGITSHAAIVSRELGIPCIIGTKIATKIFKDGDIVEVDANKGTIKKL